MYNALLEIMEPEIREREKKAEILAIIKTFREVGHTEDEIKDVLMRNYELSLQETEIYLK